VRERTDRPFFRATAGGKKEKWQSFLDVVGRGLSPQEVAILSMEIIFLSSFQEEAFTASKGKAIFSVCMSTA
jgi:hypothetical protein